MDIVSGEGTFWWDLLTSGMVFGTGTSRPGINVTTAAIWMEAQLRDQYVLNPRWETREVGGLAVSGWPQRLPSLWS